jgi:hypothetical protein
MTWRFAPAVDPAASEAGHTRGRATARPVPTRVRVVACVARCGRARVGHQTALTLSVSIGLGDMPLPRRLSRPHTMVSVHVRLITQAMAAPSWAMKAEP